MCATCIFRPGNRMHLRPGRLRDMVEGARATTPEGMAGTYITCHETLPYAGTDADPAVCRGFYDRYSTQSLQLIERLWGFIEVDPPDHIGGITMDRTTGPPMERWMKSDEVMQLFGVNYATLIRWEKAGELPTVRTPMQQRRWRQFDVEAVHAQRPLPKRDRDGRVVAESPVRPSETATDGLTPGRGD